MTHLPDVPFRYADLYDLGLSPPQLRSLVASHVVRRVLRGVYCRADLRDTIELRARCAALVLPDHAVVSDRSAAWLHGVERFDLAELEVPPALEVVSVHGHDRVRRPETLGGKRTLLPDEICEVYGVRVTTPLRTACDLACLRGRGDALAVLDAFMRRHGLTQHDFHRMLPRFRGRRGVKQLRELVPLASPLSESAGESWTVVAIVDAGLPAPTPQVWVELPGFGRVRLDLAYPLLKIAIEYDGEEFHSSGASQQADRVRRDALRAAGWLVIVVRKTDFGRHRREVWLDELREALRERTPVSRRVYSRGESWDPRRR